MTDTPMLRVKNWEEFQHYKERTPPWIRLYNRLLEDYEFSRLPDASKAHLVLVWLLASRMDNEIPADPEFIASKIGASEPVNLSTLLSSGFLEVCGDASEALAGCKQDARPEESREREETDTVHERTESEFPAKPKQVKGQYQYPPAFERAWAAYPDRDGSNPKVGAYSAFRARVARGAVPDQMVKAAEHYQRECQAKEKEGTEFVMQAATFFGPKEPWREYIDPPKLNGQRKQHDPNAGMRLTRAELAEMESRA